MRLGSVGFGSVWFRTIGFGTRFLLWLGKARRGEVTVRRGAVGLGLEPAFCEAWCGRVWCFVGWVKKGWAWRGTQFYA
jgi:hypothetical protein